MNVTKLHTGLNSLVIFRNLLAHPVIAALDRFLSAPPQLGEERVGLFCEFAAALYRQTDRFRRCLLELVLEDENIYVIRSCSEAAVDGCLEDCLEHELEFLEQLSRIDAAQLTAHLEYTGYLPSYVTEKLDFRKLYRERMKEIHQKGYGIFARYNTFTVSDGAPVPVEHPDSQTLDELPGYERERAKVVANTEALLSGRPAANVLLYGDAGTGKSSTVKAIANAYADQGLRLIEIKKNQLYQIPKLVDRLGKNPLKFILFVDDLSFQANDDNFNALKAILEGSVGGRCGNVAVYATSNRRHLVREKLSDRSGDDVHVADTMQELMSLSARFGLIVTFLKPDKERYLEIVHQLAKLYGIKLPESDLDARAEAHALRAGGRSPRAAKQLIELLAAGVLPV